MLEPCHILAGFPEELAHPAEAKASMLCGHISLSPLDPIFLLPKRIHCHTSSRHPFLVLHLMLPSSASQHIQRQVVVVFFHNNNYSTRHLSVIVLHGNQNLHFEKYRAYSRLFLLCVGRSLIHGSVLQPSHDRWVGWSEKSGL